MNSDYVSRGYCLVLLAAAEQDESKYAIALTYLTSYAIFTDSVAELEEGLRHFGVAIDIARANDDETREPDA